MHSQKILAFSDFLARPPKSYNEIADIIGTNTNNIGVRITRIKERLKRILNN